MAGESVHYSRAEYASAKRRLKLGIALGVAMVATEALFGIFTRSLALMSDAAHNAADTFAIVLSLFAVYMMEREPTERRTYGYGRVGIMTALANSVGLVAVALILVYEAVRRIQHIKPVSGTAVMIVAVVAFFINGTVAFTLSPHRHDLNIKSAFLHMVGDAAVSLGVLVAGLIILLTHWYYADPLIAILISLFILRAAWTIIRDATDVLLESVPRHLNIAKVQETVEAVPGVEAVHHLHVWEIGSGVYALSGHVEVEDRHLSECSEIMEAIHVLLKDEFNIVHPTIQMECAMQCPYQPGSDHVE